QRPRRDRNRRQAGEDLPDWRSLHDSTRHDSQCPEHRQHGRQDCVDLHHREGKAGRDPSTVALKKTGGHMMVKFASCSLVALLLAAGAVHMAAQGPSPRARDASSPGACADLKGRTFENSTTILAATPVTSGTVAPSATVSLTNLPAFCRV